MKKLAVFDLDGTLLNTLESIAFCGNTALSQFGLPMVDIKKYPDFIGNGAAVLLEKLYKCAGGDAQRFCEFLPSGFEIYKKYGSDNITVYDGIKDMIKQLSARGVGCAVLSNKVHSITQDACKKYFGDCFVCVYGQRDGVPKKPDPFMIEEIIKEVGVTKSECIYCGDSSVDVKTGKNAGVTMLGAAWGFYGDTPFADADGILYHPTEILKYI